MKLTLIIAAAALASDIILVPEYFTGFTNTRPRIEFVRQLATNEVVIGSATIGTTRFNLVALRQDTNSIARRIDDDGNHEAWTNTYQGPFVATNFVPAPVVWQTNSSSLFIDAIPLKDWRGN